MKKLTGVAVMLVFALTANGCGRDNNQEKSGGGATTTNSTPSTPAPDAGKSASSGPLQTGEQPKPPPNMPDGTQTGARTTPNPK